MPVDQIVGVKHAHCVKILCENQLVHSLRQHLALAVDDALRAENARAVPCGDGLGVVGAIVGRDDYLIQFARVILSVQAVDQMADHRRLVARCHDKGKALLRRLNRNGASLRAQPKQRDDHKINSIKAQRDT